MVNTKLTMLAHGRVHFVNTRREMGFVALPVAERTKFSGTPTNETLSQFLEALGKANGNEPSLYYHVTNAITQEVPSITCSLAADWRFEEIENEAWQRRGHSVNGLLNTDARELLRGALLDLDRAMLAQLGNLPGAALGAFWTSWQVRRHLADFCHRVILAHGGDVQIDSRPFVVALRWADEKLRTYVHEVEVTNSIERDRTTKTETVAADRNGTAGSSPPIDSTRDNKGTHRTTATRWEDIQIAFVSDERVQITVDGETETRNYDELGFADERTEKPNLAWETLRRLAEQRGIIRNEPVNVQRALEPGRKGECLSIAKAGGRNWAKIAKRVQEVRKLLRAHFGLSAEPIPFVPGTGYKACFKIGCRRSFDT